MEKKCQCQVAFNSIAMFPKACLPAANNTSQKILLRYIYYTSLFTKGKGHPITGHQGTRGGVEV
jgi:hypothetical protein